MKKIRKTDNTYVSRTEKVRVGTRIIKQLSTTFYPNALTIFDELISNANDALAENVSIEIGSGYVTIQDDGEGMTRDGLVHFFYISHTSKEDVQVRSFKNVKRFIIGKFGIGKISIYQLCKDFEITTWRDGVESSATFDFEKFERAEFVDSFALNVSSKPTDRKDHGTRITLYHLKDTARNVTLRDLKRRLSRTMPLTQNFKVSISDPKTGPIEIRAEHLDLRIAADYPIRETVDLIGPVTGRVLFFKHEDQPNHGVYIKVLGRLVNSENAQGILNINALNHPRMFSNRIRVEINADGLNNVLLTNRAGFIESSPEYIRFKDWIQKYVRKLTDLEYKKWGDLRDKIEKVDLPLVVSEAYKDMAGFIPHTLPSSEASRFDRAKTTKSIKESTHKHREHADLQTLIKKGGLKIEISDMRLIDGEAVFDRERGTLTINSRSPSYIFARSNGKLPGVVYHVFKAAAVLIAYETAANLEEFKHIYDAISNNEHLLRSIEVSFKKR